MKIYHIRHWMCLAFLLCLCLLPNTSESANRFEVQLIYFQPTDAPNPPLDKIGQLVRDTQDFYSEQMESRGHGNKTFRVESVNGNMILHIVKGKQKAQHYYNNTYQVMRLELPQNFANADRLGTDQVYLFIVGGLDLVYGGALGVGWSFTGWSAGGAAVVPGERLNMPIIAHEIGHAFGLFHNDVVNTMMGLHHGDILDYETTWIAESHYFNDTHVRTDIPVFVKNLGSEAVGKDVVRFRFSVESKSGLHQTQLVRLRGGYLVVGHDDLVGKADVSEIDVSRNKLIAGDTLSYRLMDIHGNFVFRDIVNVQLPAPIPTPVEPEPIEPEPIEPVEPEPIEPEVIEPEACPGCNPDESDLRVSRRGKLTTRWASLKEK